MKKLVVLSVFVLAMVFSTDANAQKFSGLDKSPADIAVAPSSNRIPNKDIKVIYSRPQLKGRAIGDLAPAGKVWRTGANEASEITFYNDTNFGGKDVKAGTYSLFTIPGATEWEIILNSNLNQWGAYSYDKSADVTRVSGKVSKGDDSLEALSVAFTDSHMVIGWGKTRVSVPFAVAK